MNEESSSPNIEWKKTGFDLNERATLKTNVRKAVEYEAKNKNSGFQRKYVPTPAELPNGIKKIRKKIKDVWDDEEDDEEEYQIVNTSALDGTEDNIPLMNALQADEKKLLTQNDEIFTVNTLFLTERNQKLADAEKMSKDVGLKGLDKDVLATTSQNMTIGENLTNNAISTQVARSFKYKGAKIPEKDAKKLFLGLKKIQKTAGKNAIANLTVKEVIEVGSASKNDKIIVRKMLEKSGRIGGKKKKNLIQKNDLQLKNAKLAKKLEQTSRF